jgi:translocation and assembly module TamA
MPIRPTCPHRACRAGRRALARPLWVLGGLLAAIPGPAPHAADPQPYTVDIGKTGIAPLDTALTASSNLVALRTQAPAGPFALVARAQQDIPRLQTALEAFGYYDAKVGITIDGHPTNELQLPDQLAAAPARPPVPVVVTIDKGTLFHLRHVEVTGDVPPDIQKQLGPVQQGAPAVAADVLAAGNRMLDALRRAGHPFAKLPPPTATLVPSADALDVAYHADPGPHADLGPITLSSLGITNPAFVRRRLLIHQGEPFDPNAINDAQGDLMGTGIFSSVQVRLASQLDSNGQLPVELDFQPRPRRSIGLTALYSTDLGASVGVTWTYRNVFGNAEQLTLKAAATQIGGTATDGLGYDVGADYSIPDWLRRDQTLDTSIEALKQDLPAYDRTAELAGSTITRKLSPVWTVSAGVLGTIETDTQEGSTFDYQLLQLPMSLKFDNTGSLFDPVHGARATLTVIPTESFGHSTQTFGIFSIAASTYIDAGAHLGFAAPGRSILAVRGMFGTIPGINALQIPPDARFYAGGSDTVRGYKYQTVGPLFPGDDNPVGGTYIATATAEWRQRILSSYGVVAFVDTGTVSAPGTPFGARNGVGVGVGARYFTSIGPIRLDVGVPLTHVPGDQAFQIYIGLGQAF